MREGTDSENICKYMCGRFCESTCELNIALGTRSPGRICEDLSREMLEKATLLLQRSFFVWTSKLLLTIFAKENIARKGILTSVHFKMLLIGRHGPFSWHLLARTPSSLSCARRPASHATNDQLPAAIVSNPSKTLGFCLYFITIRLGMDK